MKKIFTLVLVLFTLHSFGQILEPVKWKYESKDLGDNTFELIFSASVEHTWHLYSQSIPPGGPQRTSFVFYNMDNFELIEDAKIEKLVNWDDTTKRDFRVTFNELEGHTEFDKQFDMELKFFGEDTQFKQKFRWKGEKTEIKGFLEFMCCDDTQCLPPALVDFSFYGGSQASTSGEKVSETSGKYKDTIEMLEDPSVIERVKDSLGNTSLLSFFFFAFIAGLAAIITPCVFPMIPMTVSFFLKEEGAKAKIQALFFGFSIVAIYTIVGTVIAVTLGVNFANWLSTHWLPNTMFFLIFVVFAASFFGMFEITMPSWMINKSDAKADKGGFIGSFFMAFTLVLVSFSCTGPLVGMILVKAAAGDWIEPIVGMLGFSIAFALPFSIFAFFPSLMKSMPKSGGWLNSVKVILGFIELALGLKFLSIADQTYHWHILDREVYLGLWIVIFTLMGIYLMGKIKFSHDSEVKYIGVPRLFLIIITFSFVMYLIPGMWGAPLKALSGYLPPMASHDFDLNAINRKNLKAALGVDDNAGICETPKYHEFLHLPHGINGYYDYEQALTCAKKLDKPIFIDFTGHGCVNCREMEANVWSDPSVLKLLKEDFIVVSLYVDDKTRLPESEWVKNKDGEVLKTLGKINADLQIQNFHINAQPYYVILSPEGKLLSKPKVHDLNVDNYVKFLKTAKENFKLKKGL